MVFWLFADVNECQNGEHNCDVNARCNNTFGSFNCTCLQGYSGNGVNCSGKVAFVFIVVMTNLFGTSTVLEKSELDITL